MNPASESSESRSATSSAGNESWMSCQCVRVAAMLASPKPYLSQIEHGLRAPSEAVLETTAATLCLSP